MKEERGKWEREKARYENTILELEGKVEGMMAGVEKNIQERN